jgi:hypothetical protein
LELAGKLLIGKLIDKRMTESLGLAEHQGSLAAVVTDVACEPLETLKRVFVRLEDISVVCVFTFLDLERC